MDLGWVPPFVAGVLAGALAMWLAAALSMARDAEGQHDRDKFRY